jgi:hypothetical protein
MGQLPRPAPVRVLLRECRRAAAQGDLVIAAGGGRVRAIGPDWPVSAGAHEVSCPMVVSVNEQVTGHKVVVIEAPPAGSRQRQASCQCGWRSPQDRTEQVMPQIRAHLDAAVTARHHGDRPNQRQRGHGSRR